MTESEVLEVLDRLQVRQQGHFLLSSGNHSDTYLQCARLFEWPKEAERLCEALAVKLQQADLVPEVVVGPALGAILPAYELARALSVRNCFAERKDGVHLSFQRGFHIAPGERVVVIEDVVTTGKSARETLELVKAAGARVVAVTAIIDRSQGVDFGVPFLPLVRIEARLFSPEECPLCKAGEKLFKPGSRKFAPGSK